MPIVTVSGHSRKVGKTSIVEGLISALPEYRWTALKVSSHRHPVNCENYENTEKDCIVVEETCGKGGNDASRFIKAGAVRAFWIQAERIEAAAPAIRSIIKDATYVVIEGNGVLDCVTADFSILVVNCGVEEFKKSARDILARADALVLIDAGAGLPEWKNLLESIPKNIPRFETGDPGVFPPALKKLLSDNFYLKVTSRPDADGIDRKGG